MIKTSDRTDIPEKRGERGFALMLVLVVLVTLTILGVGVMTSVSTNSALSRNYEISTQAANMAEIGAKVAYREFINSGFLNSTHKLYGTTVQASDSLLTTTLSNYYIDSAGWYVWEWDSEKAYNPLWDTTTPHGFKFRVYYSSSFAFVIESEGWYGTIHRRIRAKGEVETMYQFGYFDGGDLGEFTRGASQEIKGKVHANGNLYVRPTGADLKVNTDSFTASGYIVRSRDAWGRPDTSGRCLITKNNQDSGIWVEMTPGSPRGSEGLAFDSFNANWNSSTLGAKVLWGGVVRDRVPFKSPPPIQNLDAGGYYETNAGLKITSTTHATKAWATQKTFWNYNEQRNVTVEDINFSALMATADWPSNGLIYSSTSIRLYNADSLKTKLTVTCNKTIYTKGNYNTKAKKGASIIAKHRIYHLSGNWNDSFSTTSPSRAASTTTINSALVDGSPTVDEYNWADRDEDHRYDYNNTLIYDNWNNKTAAGFNDPANVNDPWANCDDLLENWSGITLTKLGSVVHLTGGTMAANLDNSGITADQIAWVRKLGYSAPTRVYKYDTDLATAGGQPPFTPLIGSIKTWEPY